MKKTIYTSLLALLVCTGAYALPYTPPTGSSPNDNVLCGHKTSNPVVLVENAGQVTDQFHNPRSDVKFMVPSSGGLRIFVGVEGLHYQFATKAVSGGEELPSKIRKGSFSGQSPEGSTANYTCEVSRMDMTLVGANTHAKIIRQQPQEYTENYLRGDDHINGSTAHSFSRVTYKDIYPHIDWVLSCNGAKLKQEFVVHKHGDPKNIKMKYGGQQKLNLADDGSMVATCDKGEIKESAPYTYQADGKDIATSYKLNGSELSFELAPYDGEIVIDPQLMWATYFGGADDDGASCVATDDSGNVYMGGIVGAAGTIATTGVYQTTFGGGTYDAFLTKFSAAGTRLWATYFGGPGDESIWGVALDNNHNIYTTGFTSSLTGMATPGAFQTASGGSYDAFLAKFNNNGQLKWSTYYGGSNKEFGNGVTTDRFGNVYLAAQSNSTSGVASPGAYQTVIGDGSGLTEDALLAKFDSSGNRTWATYYGGDGPDFGNSTALDTSGNIYFSGFTGSSNQISTPGALQTLFGGGNYDAFLVKFSASGTPIWGTYLGGSSDDESYAVRVDAQGNCYFTGFSASTDGIATPGTYQSTNQGSSDGFIAKITPEGTIVWSTYFGGLTDDYVYAAALDDTGNVYIAGNTSSHTLVATTDGVQPAYGGGTYDAFVAKFDSTGARKWATYYGGDALDQAYGVATDKYANIFLAGSSTSNAGIATTGAYQSTYAGGASTGDAFLAKMHPNNSVGVPVTQNANQTEMRLYPQPATGLLCIDVAQNGAFSVYNAAAAVLGVYNIQAGINKISLPPGTIPGSYYCSFRDADGRIQSKFFIVAAEK